MDADGRGGSVVRRGKMQDTCGFGTCCGEFDGRGLVVGEELSGRCLSSVICCVYCERAFRLQEDGSTGNNQCAASRRAFCHLS